MSNQPKKLIAALLGFSFTPIGMMYVAKIRLALVYLLLLLATATGCFIYIREEIIVGAIQLIFPVIGAFHAYLIASRFPIDGIRPTYSKWYVLLGSAFGFFLFIFTVRVFIIEPFRFPSGSMLPTIPPGSHLIVQKWGYGNYGTYGFSLLHRTISAPLRRGDIVVFEFPPDRDITYAKRLIGLPGDNIEYRNKRLIINGQPVKTNIVGAHHYADPGLNIIQGQIREEFLGTSSHTTFVQPEPPSVILSHVAEFPQRNLCQHDESGFVCKIPEGSYLMLGDNRDASNDSRYWGFVPAGHVVGKVLHIVK